MSWITQRDAKDAANYRYIEFTGGRILQAEELKDVQDTEALRAKRENLALFRPGALMNAQAVFHPGTMTVNLTKTDVHSRPPRRSQFTRQVFPKCRDLREYPGSRSTL